MSGYFLTATGTGIGKTFATCALIHAAHAANKPIHACKPIISGFDAADAASDTALIGSTLGDALPADSISPWRFAAPLSPHRAAAHEGKMIDAAALESWCRAQLRLDAITLIEGAGGVMVPITDRYTMCDLMAALKLPVILVVGSYLGTISHTLTALSVLRAAELRVAALILNETEGSTVTLAETEAGLTPFIGDIPLRITQPRVSSPLQAHAIHALMEQLT